ncbi:DNA-binding transcriptional activator of the SARP family [Micromonospora purpureochromogenes]|uniref:DNA-binding transcriptional activator of the SARP family n=1 Tax=Micromonospora purpureochromogenes TaxID=47872 RepID=A0A1C4Y869_9ACTN|nr:AfsR/SARP family transcriptional regulator [Micromonospora purpureochromogenes]SCF16929.1 DNA-binding transcriptional activator of the SARP family [Micromonospora purpureochromogenes]
MRFNVLGPLEIITDDDRPIDVSPSKTGQVLALLIARCPDAVAVDTLIRELWGEKPPRSAVTTLQTYIYHGRRMLARELSPLGQDLVSTRAPGYAMRIAAHDVDVNVFERLVQRARELLVDDEPEAALRELRTALDLWRGPAFAGLAVGEVLAAHIAHLDEVRLQATHLRITAERRLGRHLELVAELRALVAAHPLNESFHAQLIEVLYESGRRAEALQAYQNLRGILARELGVEPTVQVQRLQLTVLQGEDSRLAGLASR